MTNRTALLVWVDSAMLLLVCLLECVSLTGLDLHKILGFVLSPLVLLHVVTQWPWFITQFHRMRSSRERRARINALLNVALLVLMSAVLLSGILVSRVVVNAIGERFGRVRIWSEIHGGLNFVLVVLVGLHLAMNWDWIVAALRRRAPERPPLAGTKSRNVSGTPGRPSRGQWPIARPLARGVVVLLIASATAGTIYFLLASLSVSEEPGRMQDKRTLMPATLAEAGPALIGPQRRPASLPQGLEQLTVTTVSLVLIVIIGRYVFRLRL